MSRPAPSVTDRHLVLDLDSTLVHSQEDMLSLTRMQLYSNPLHAALRDRIYSLHLVDVVTPPGTGKVTQMWGVYRPFLFEFMNFANTYFQKVHLWSAGQHKYVHAIKDLLFQNSSFSPATVFSYYNCDISHSKGLVVKPLERLFAEETGAGADPTNTLALDDRMDTFSQNPGNGILIPPYEPKSNPTEIAAIDDALLKLMCWLSLPKVMAATDVRNLDKSTIFSTSLDEYAVLLGGASTV